MKFYKFYLNITSNLLLFLLATIVRLNITTSTEAATVSSFGGISRQKRDEFSQSWRDGGKPSANQQYNIPFLVLMSSKEISVAQLPLIDNGTVSVAYQLPPVTYNEGDGSSRVVVVARTGNEASVKASADAREYEQMPQTTSLGKSEWQQIAGSKLARDQDREEVGKKRNEDADATAADSSEQPASGNQEERRPRRSNSLIADEDGNGSEDGNSANNSNRGGGAVLDSGAPNVTSAQFEGKEEERRGAAATAAPVAAAAAAADPAPAQASTLTLTAEDDKNGGVQFSDFDVHVALGYAFAADSAGRIHKFRLTSPERAGISNESSSRENDYTNTIVAVASTATDFSPSQTGALATASAATNGKSSRVNFSKNEADNGGSHDDVDDANRVSQDDVTHEQSGRHPALSSRENLLAYAGSATPTSGAEFTASASGVNHGSEKQQGEHFSGGRAEPKVIWSRIKYGSKPTPRSVELQKGAFPSAGPDSRDVTNQMAKETEHMEGGDEDDGLQSSPSDQQRSHSLPSERESEQIMSAADGGNNQASDRFKLGHNMKTEIAVDWLNNLLFVLDKYRLVVIDFDGNNELVIIDDFNANNRPIDIKVDPVNDFIFWLQAGKFHNTIYKLDLSVLLMPTATERMNMNALKMSARFPDCSTSDCYSSDLVALISHHYAHPIITNLPKHAKLFTIDHKHSRIYVPLTPMANDSGLESNKTQRDETEVFAPPLSAVTHMNNTFLNQLPNELNSLDDVDRICNSSIDLTSVQILAYNLDGTDVGPLRGSDEKSHLSSFGNIQDMALDSANGYLYMLTNDGKELFEEFKSGRDRVFYSAQHSLDGKRYTKLLHFDNGSNQPTHLKPRFNLSKLTNMMLSLSSRLPRSEKGSVVTETPDGHNNFSVHSPNAPYIIMLITCLAVLCIYLMYSFVFQHSARSSRNDNHCDSSLSESSIGDSQVDCGANSSGFIGTSTISRWIPKPPTRSSNNSTFNQHSDGNEQVEPCDFESTNYNTSNAIDEHYRHSINNQVTLDVETNRLANWNEWPNNMNYMSNKFYVPVEVLRDGELASINRITIDQLDIDRRSPLGEGHFGTVLQGTITCTLSEKSSMLNKSLNNPQAINSATDAPLIDLLAVSQHSRIVVSSSTSSGHGSSSTSSDFITAQSCADAMNGDYLVPKSHTNSAMSDYAVDNPTSSRSNSCSSYHNTNITQSIQDELRDKKPDIDKPAFNFETKLKVAIKKLKDNASPEEKRDFLQEAKLLANFDHRNIVHLIGICLDRGSTLIVMELMLGGDLIRYMQENTPRENCPDNLSYDDLLSICLDIASGCCYLEEEKYIHRDLAARNCLVSSRKKEERVVKLADFGLARDIYKDSYYRKLNDSGAMPLKWMAPECLIEQKFTTMSDVWSFGVVMWEVMSYCQEKPYGNVEPLFMKEYLTGGARLRQPDDCSDDIYKLMSHCWQLEPGNRPTFQECRAILIEIKNRGRH